MIGEHSLDRLLSSQIGIGHEIRGRALAPHAAGALAKPLPELCRRGLSGR